MIGRHSAKLVLRAIAADEPLKPKTVLLIPELIIRESTLRARHGRDVLKASS